MTLTTSGSCPSCGRALGTGVLAGLCPACTWDSLCLESEDPPDASSHESGGAERPRHIAGHEILEEIGRGGGGIVYRARQLEPRREVALKILPSAFLPADDMRARFRAEAATVAALDHPAILPVYGSGEHDGMPWFTMKLAAGGSLAARREALRGNWREIAALVADLADAVQHAHERGVIHRDIKPGNILFDEAGRAYVSDFGLAKFIAGGAAAPGLTQPLAVLGTPAYLAPEAAERGAAATTASADIYSLGAVLYELLTGRPPFEAGSIVSLLRQIAVQPATPPRRIDAAVPRDLEVICLRALAKEPAGRFPGAGAFAADLRRWLARRPIESRPVPAAERAWFWARRNPALAVLSAVLSLGLLAGGAVLAESNRRLRAAQAESREQLRAALMAEGRLLRQSGVQGQHFEALATLERARSIRSGLDVRNEVAAALARPDLRLVRRLPAAFSSEITVTAFTPDLATYLEAAPGGFALRDARDGALVRTFSAEGVEAGADYFVTSADGRRARVYFRDNTNQVWDLRDGRLLWRGGAGEIALHPDRAVIAHADTEGAAWMLDLVTGMSRELPQGTPVLAMAFAPDGARLAVARERGLEIHDTDTPGRVSLVEGWFNSIEPAWSPDGRWLAAGGEPAFGVHIIDAANGRLVRTLRGHTAPLPSFQFHPDGRRLYTYGRDDTLRLWDALSGAELLRVPVARRALTVARDGRFVGASISPQELAIYEAAPERVLREFRGRELSGRVAINLAVSPDGRWLATCDRQEVRVWSVAQGREVAHFPFAEPDWPRVLFAPGGDALVYSGRSQGPYRRSFHAAGTDDTPPSIGPEVQIGVNRDGMLLGFSRGGRDWMIEREKIGRVVVWPEGDPARERAVAQSGRFERPEFSEDGRWVVTMGYPRVNTRLWSAADAALIGPVPVRLHSGAEFSPDGRWLLTGSLEGFRLWQVPGMEPGPGWPLAEAGGAAWGVTRFSPDGRIIACEQGPGRIVLREAATGAELIALAPPLVQGLSHVAWSPDGARLFLFYDDHRVFGWEIGELRRELAARGLDW